MGKSYVLYVLYGCGACEVVGSRVTTRFFGVYIFGGHARPSEASTVRREEVREGKKEVRHDVIVRREIILLHYSRGEEGRVNGNANVK